MLTHRVSVCHCLIQSWLLVEDRIHLDHLRVHPGSLHAQPSLTGMQGQKHNPGPCRNRERGRYRAQPQPALQDAAQHRAYPWQEQAAGPLPSTCLQDAAPELCRVPQSGATPEPS